MTGSWGRQGSSSWSTTEFLRDPSGVVYSLHAWATAPWVVQRRNTLKTGGVWIQEYPRAVGLAYLYIQRTFRDNNSESIKALMANVEVRINRGNQEGTQEQWLLPSANYMVLELKKRSFLTKLTLGVFLWGITAAHNASEQKHTCVLCPVWPGRTGSGCRVNHGHCSCSQLCADSQMPL